jgi:dipeptide/tripeptide permease
MFGNDRPAGWVIGAGILTAAAIVVPQLHTYAPNSPLFKFRLTALLVSLGFFAFVLDHHLRKAQNRTAVPIFFLVGCALLFATVGQLFFWMFQH